MPTSFAEVLPVVAMAAITLAASIAEPPPIASIESLPCARTAAAPLSSTSWVGSGTMPSNTATSIPSTSSERRTGSTRPSFTSTASVTIRVRRAPEPPISRHNLAADPGPTKRTGRGIATSQESGFMKGFMRR